MPRGRPNSKCLVVSGGHGVGVINRRLLQIGEGMSIAEHIHCGEPGLGADTGNKAENAPLSRGDTLVCFGKDKPHERLEDFLIAQNTISGH
jgi:hypothetical protein